MSGASSSFSCDPSVLIPLDATACARRVAAAPASDTSTMPYTTPAQPI